MNLMGEEECEDESDVGPIHFHQYHPDLVGSMRRRNRWNDDLRQKWTTWTHVLAWRMRGHESYCDDDPFGSYEKSVLHVDGASSSSLAPFFDFLVPFLWVPTMEAVLAKVIPSFEMWYGGGHDKMYRRMKLMIDFVVVLVASYSEKE
jgi:hypothetical protein